MKDPPSCGRKPTHGAGSKEIQKRYSDLRTKQGQRLAAITKGLRDDLGGEAQLSTAQRILIGNIKSKLIVIYQISDWADKQPEIVNKVTGELLPALGRGFLAYTDSISRDLAALQKFSSSPKKLNLGDYVKLKEVKSK